jgi:hypothetical protein
MEVNICKQCQNHIARNTSHSQPRSNTSHKDSALFKKKYGTSEKLVPKH